MIFPTLDFLLFIVPVLLVFWALSHRPVARVWFLLAVSVFFYTAGPKTDPPPVHPFYVGLLLFSTVLDYACGLAMHRETPGLSDPDPRVAQRARRRRNAILGVSLVGNLGLLAYYKYVDFFVDTAADLAAALGIPFVAPTLHVILPLGISFYTFQSLSYTIDVWRQRLTPERSFGRFALFVTFFPQLVAGPIVRASELLPQLHLQPRLSAERMNEGLFRIWKGLVKKVVLGDWIAAHFTDAVFGSPEHYTGAEILFALYAFTLQLYADFSGYSDIAIGVARLLGYDIPENFDRPHQAKNIGEFWRRWHMTLSTWLRDYLFFPLGGSRGSPARTYFNLWLTMFLVGMWHYSPGTSWNFVIYANLQAGAIVFNRWNKIRSRTAPVPARLAVTLALAGFTGVSLFALGRYGLALAPEKATILGLIASATFLLVTWLPDTGRPLNTALHILLTFHFTVISRVFFRADSFDTARRMIDGLLTFDGRAHLIRDGLMGPWIWAALVLGIGYHYTPKAWVDVYAYRVFRRIPGPLLGLMFALLGLALMKLMEGGPRAFIYFNF